MTCSMLLLLVYLILHDSVRTVHIEILFLVFVQGYQFEEDNPYLSHPDPLSEGVKRMEAGDIPGAVRFFESAVQREPDNQLVRLSSLCFHLHLSVSKFFDSKCRDAPIISPKNIILLIFVSTQKAVVIMSCCLYFAFINCRHGNIWAPVRQRTSKNLLPSAPSAGWK